jgi:hypothetical protein
VLIYFVWFSFGLFLFLVCLVFFWFLFGLVFVFFCLLFVLFVFVFDLVLICFSLPLRGDEAFLTLFEPVHVFKAKVRQTNPSGPRERALITVGLPTTVGEVVALMDQHRVHRVFAVDPMGRPTHVLSQVCVYL